MDISPDEFRRGPKNPPCAFFLIQDGRHHVTPFSKKTRLYHNFSLLQLEKNIKVSLLMFEDTKNSSR